MLVIFVENIQLRKANSSVWSLCPLFIEREGCRAFKLNNQIELKQARYNIAPTQEILVVRQENNHHVGEMARWGLIPSWSKEIGKWSTFNARAETVADKHMFRTPFRHKRCLIPANGYYEWEAANGKQPWYIHPAKGELLAFAGLYDNWTSPEGEEIQSVTIIVCDASDDTRRIHDRMPVIIKHEDWDHWLDTSQLDFESLKSLLKSTPPGFLNKWQVSKAVNSSRQEGEKLIEKLRK